MVPKGGAPTPHVITEPRALRSIKPGTVSSSTSGRRQYRTDHFERAPQNRLFHVSAGGKDTRPPSGPIDLNHPPPGSRISGMVWQHLPPDDRQAIWEQHVAANAPTVGGAPGTVEPTNPALAEFLAQHPEIVTNQDFLNSFATDGVVNWSAFNGSCAELRIAPGDILNYRSAPIRDLAYPPPVPDGSLPSTAEEANDFHIVQYTDPVYNPTGPGSSVNCGPASLAMALDTQGLIPPGLTPEQKVDYARGLMMGTHNAEITVNGQTVYLLDNDNGATALTGKDDIINGASAAGLNAVEQSGWAELDAALAAGDPIVAFGNLYPEWRAQFADLPGHYGGGEIPHFIAILGRTADGKYVVNDPMFTGGAVEMTRDELAVFFNKDGDNTPNFVSVEGRGTEAPPEAEVPVQRHRME